MLDALLSQLGRRQAGESIDDALEGLADFVVGGSVLDLEVGDHVEPSGHFLA